MARTRGLVGARSTAVTCGGSISASGAFVAGLYVFVPPFKGSALGDQRGGPVRLVWRWSSASGIFRPRAQLAWWLLVAGVFLFWVGDVYTYSIRSLFNADVPFPSFGDAIYLTMYPVLMAGIMLLVRRRNQRADGPGAVDALIMTLGLALVSGILLIAPYVHDKTLSLLPKLVSIGYPMGDIILLAAGIRLAVDARQAPAGVLPADRRSIVTMLVTDYSYGISRCITPTTISCGSTRAGSSSISCGAPRRCTRRCGSSPRRRPSRQPRLTWLRLALLAGATLIAPALEIIKVIPTRNWDLLFVVGASAVLFSLVVARMTGLVRQREKSVARERALSAAGGLLVGATAPEDIVTAALEAVADFGERERGCARVPDLRRAGSSDGARLGRRPVRVGDLRRGSRRSCAMSGAGGVSKLPGARTRRAEAAGGQRSRSVPRAPSRRSVERGPDDDPRRRGRRRRRDAVRAAHARPPGFARALKRRARRGGPPPHERGEVRDARAELQRPDHGDRRRQQGPLPEPVDRARPRVHRRGGHRPPVRAAAPSR